MPLIEHIFSAGLVPRNSHASSRGSVELVLYRLFLLASPPCICKHMGSLWALQVLTDSSECPPKRAVLCTMQSGTPLAGHLQHGKWFTFSSSACVISENHQPWRCLYFLFSSELVHDSSHWTFLFLLWFGQFIHYSNLLLNGPFCFVVLFIYHRYCN